MKLHVDLGTPTLDITDRLFVELHNDYEQLYGVISGRSKYNWYNLTFFVFTFMVDDFVSGWELEFIILGLGVRVRYNSPESDKYFSSIEDKLDTSVKSSYK